MWKVKKWIFSKNCLTPFVSGREKNHFRAHYLFWPKFFLDQNSVNQENYKNSGFSRNCPEPRMTPFSLKRCFFDMGEKVGFTNCVFERLCFFFFFWKHYFIVFSAKHSFSKAKIACWKKTENLWKIVGCFWTWQNGVFGFVFEALMLLWFVFGVFGIVPEVSKVLVFPIFGFCGVVYSSLFWVWKV